MTEILGTVFIGLVVTVLVVLAIRSLWRNRKSSCSCGGNCASCCGCVKGHSHK